MTIETPELDKMAKANEEGSQAIGEFLDWLNQQGILLCRWREDLTDIQPCFGFNRFGEVISAFDLTESNCDGGKVKYAPFRREAGTVLYGPGDVCPRCEGKGGLEFAASARFVVEPGNTQEMLARYFDIDLDKVEQERRALLDAFRAKTS